MQCCNYFSKTIFILAFLFSVSHSVSQSVVKAYLNGYEPKTTISRHIYGQFAEHLGRCVYDGFWITNAPAGNTGNRFRMDVVNALKKIKVPNLRWPGGCFADEYHWSDGIGPGDQRPKTINTTWGMVTEDNSFGTHEFLELCKLIGCEPYMAGNVGTGSPKEMANWIEYLNFNGDSKLANQRRANGQNDPYKVSFWGVGNENWGCGGNMTAEYYSNLYKQYANFCENYPGAPLKKIVGGANAGDYNWTEVCMKNIPLNQMWGISIHYYTVPTGNWSNKGSATQFNEKEYFTALSRAYVIEDIVTRNEAIMNRYDPQKRVALCVDEWGIWTNAEPGTTEAFLFQQNSLRDALVAGTTLNIFNNHSERVRMANLAQAVNVLQALILTEGNKMLLTPTYHVFDMYKVHQDAKLLPVQFSSPDYVNGTEKIQAVNISASQDSTGAIHISLVNLDPSKKITVRTTLNGLNWKSIEGQVLTSAKFNDINTFSRPDLVKPVKFSGAKKEGNDLIVELPAQSIVVLELKE
ncbi:MAG TPA: alpha-L-arabinofuranosidase C-terminal domain-containing protein [Chitinophagaceae bacterium]